MEILIFEKLNKLFNYLLVNYSYLWVFKYIFNLELFINNLSVLKIILSTKYIEIIYWEKSIEKIFWKNLLK